MDIVLSLEQQEFIEKALEGNNILVDACIGSGKTTAIQRLCDELPESNRILYLTYNRLLKLDAKKKIKNRNATVSNYHGFATICLQREGISAGVSDLIQTFLRTRPPIGSYDILIIDEYQDIEQELSKLLELIREENPHLQIIAVGDMEQKIYDKTTLDVQSFMQEFLGDYELLHFTQCFRLSAGLASMLGRVWNKPIHGVNTDCAVTCMSQRQVVNYLAEQKPGDILCLGARTGTMADVLNRLEGKYPERFNKRTVYATIQERGLVGSVEPGGNTAIFTTYDSSKGMERSICVIFDFTESYWQTRMNKPQQSYQILRNIFCVAASRGKSRVIFVLSDGDLLSEKTLKTFRESRTRFDDMDISSMFDFKYKEDVENCYFLLQTKRLPPTEAEDTLPISIPNADGMIDLSPCIGIYQEAAYFKNYDIHKAIRHKMQLNPKLSVLYNERIQGGSLEEKILFLVSLETEQRRYRTQVQVPFITPEQKQQIMQRLATRLPDEVQEQQGCSIDFCSPQTKLPLFSAKGLADAVLGDTVYELKFVSELSHEHFLQCASYVAALGLKKGILWNIRDNTAY